MNSWKLYYAGLCLTAGLAPAALAQGLPAITPPANLAPVNPPVNAPVPPAAAPPNIWDKLCPRADQKAACKAKICNCPLGQLLNNMLAPAGAMTGGIIGPFCPTISAADLAKPADSAEGAAARLKADEADAAARRAAIRYMAGADCHYWPEVTEALIGALRSDRNECVRLEAALALGRGCCCNRATMKALTLSVSGSTEDGNPAEDSERVKCAAMAALNHCLANYTEVVPAPEVIKPDHGGEKPGEKGGEKGGELLPPPMPNAPTSQKQPFSPTEFYHHAANLDERKVVEQARRAAAHVTPVTPSAPSPEADHSLFGIVRAAVTPPPGAVVPAEVVMEKPTTVPVVVPAVLVQPAKSTPAAPAAPLMPLAPVKSTPPAPLTLVAPVAPAKSTPAVAPAATTATVAPAAYYGQAEKASPVIDKTPSLPPAPVPMVEKTPSLPPAPVPAVAAPTPAAAAPQKISAAAAPPPVAAAPPKMNAAVIANTIAILRDSINPEEREMAADALGSCDRVTNPNVVQALVEAGRSDAAPLVRAASLRSLGRMDVRTLPVATVAQALKTDPDPRVRTEAENLIQLISGSTTAHNQ